MKIFLLVGGALFKDKKILLLRRSENQKLFPKHWEIPGGKIEIGEKPRDSLKREFKEEAGIDVRILKPYNVWAEIHDNDLYIEIDFIVTANDFSVKLGKEHDKYGWFAKNDIENLIMTKSQRTTVKKAFEILAKSENFL